MKITLMEINLMDSKLCVELQGGTLAACNCILIRSVNVSILNFSFHFTKMITEKLKLTGPINTQ